VGRNSLRGPHFSQLDFSAFKDFHPKEKLKLQFRAEVYNITNTENFGQPNITIGKWRKTVDPIPGCSPCNTGAPGATPILGQGGCGQITQSNLALNPRQYQFALKLIF